MKYTVLAVFYAWPQGLSSAPQEASRSSHNSPKRAPGAAKLTPGAAQAAPRGAQDSPGGAKSRPGLPQRATKAAKRHLRGPTKPSRTCPEGPKMLQKALKRRPRGVSRGSLQGKVHQPTWLQDCPVHKACPNLQPAPRRPCSTRHMDLVRRRTAGQGVLIHVFMHRRFLDLI